MNYRKSHIYQKHSILLLSVFVLSSMLITTLVHAGDEYTNPRFLKDFTTLGASIDLNVNWADDEDQERTGYKWLLPSNLHGQVQKGVYMLQISNTPSSASSLLDRRSSSNMKMTLGVGYRDPAVNQFLDSGLGTDDLMLGTREDQYRITGPMMFMSIGKRW
ncbi:MAG TPA: hypothetical protein ENI64_01735 [Gammaproteobacteria bacterium]|nr:hypothetical protein [Gammaproteobacteria bacterium]